MTPPEKTQPEKTQHDARKPFLDLSLPQLVAGAVAAATAAILSRQIGLLGTVVGAAFASVVSAVVTSGLVGGWQRVRTVPSRFPRNVSGMLVTAAALGLVAVALHTGVDLLTRDLPRDTFAARWLAEVGVGVNRG